MISEAADMCQTEVFLSDKGVTCQIHVSPTVTSSTTYNGFYKYLDIPLVKITIGLAYYYHWKEIFCTADREILHFTPCEKFLSHPRYLTPVAPCVQVFFFNIGCKGCHVISSLSAHVTMTSKRFISKWRTPRL